MIVAPGQSIPFWLRLWNGNDSRYVIARVTSIIGLEQPGSPYSLTYSGNRGIYTGLGPVMGGVILLVDYEVYLDSLFTQLDNSYLPASDWVEPSTSGGVLNQYFGTPIVVAPQISQVNVSVSTDAVDISSASNSENLQVVQEETEIKSTQQNINLTLD